MAQTVVNVSHIKQGEVAAALDDIGNVLAGTASAGNIQTANIKGVATNSNATALYLGELLSTNVASGSAVALTTATAANVATLSLTAGDWDVYANILFVPAATTSITILKGGINTTTATLPTAPNSGGYMEYVSPAFVPTAAGAPGLHVRMRQSLSATTNIFLVTTCTFTVAALSAYGFIGARRVR